MRSFAQTQARAAAFTIPELMLCIGIVALLATLVVPAFKGAMERSRAMRCIAHLRSWGALVGAYGADHNGALPMAFVPVSEGGNISWNHFDAPLARLYAPASLSAWRRGAEINGCPQHGGSPYGGKDYTLRYYSYAINGHLTHAALAGAFNRIANIPSPSRTILIADASDNGSPYTVFSDASNGSYFFEKSLGSIHAGRINALFADSHIEALSAVRLEQVQPGR